MIARKHIIPIGIDTTNRHTWIGERWVVVLYITNQQFLVKSFLGEHDVGANNTVRLIRLFHRSNKLFRRRKTTDEKYQSTENYDNNRRYYYVLFVCGRKFEHAKLYHSFIICQASIISSKVDRLISVVICILYE
jgi:hypothetical protein